MPRWWGRLQRREAADGVLGRWQKVALVVVVALPVCFNAVALWPEATSDVPTISDDAFHYLMIRSGSEALANEIGSGE